ncbi:uncharacterized protein N7483_000709 [Penicillium malachiteum]|uniref:uncharacterized protein n=1 Tax=Penicillium malachiteum TaxID=1324776 RepID=UPI002546E30A|nr:uncharacterized protein N7483_000709 [Penicillium malachiteum]KAJ5735584.1 hypothetical protein N7483_000709 [Penicillium malachiteum]
MATRAQKRVNLAVSKVVPPLIIGFIIYACYVVTKPLCIDYLIHPLPHYHRTPRVGAGVVILVLYFILLIPMLGTYLRLLYNTKPQNTQTHDSVGVGDQETPREPEKGDETLDMEQGVISQAEKQASQSDELSLETFYTKEVFVCQDDGRPQYCSTCCQFKMDRSHHCREIDRCVRKMDHFCPWVGGVVSETTFKFFVQFVAYTALFCTFALIISAYFTAELRRDTGSVNPHLSGFFGFFTFSMTVSSLQMAMMNITTIENLGRRSRVWTLAIRVPDHLLQRLWVTESPWAPTFRMVSYPPEAPTTPPQPQTTDPSTEQRYVFAILHTQPGENPYDLGGWKNLQQVMGYNLTDWLIPWKPSPCTDHSSQESAFALGPVVARLKQDAGLI